ncbi:MULTISPECIES: hypothetical protein [Xanthomonas]|uniref:hypothetical protein n=1 Tax=Xanthomonas TaxID=338 RepID=UPI000EFFC1FF|nr:MULTISPECIES: hypothetical protein [Xanthomonas]AYO97551.1 hypothetical protein Xcom_21420 [Xanthomonas axonopodis pv. commiphoreae]MBV6890049.1 hypothetical protein [Xanthomonas campestris pv. spermacoces]QTK41659.1 hypothetical protein XcgCFBP7119R_24030 [Xanthomonas citri pv. glycines]
MAIACAAGIELASAGAVRYPSASPAGDVRGLAKSALGRRRRRRPARWIRAAIPGAAGIELASASALTQRHACRVTCTA